MNLAMNNLQSIKSRPLATWVQLILLVQLTALLSISAHADEVPPVANADEVQSGVYADEKQSGAKADDEQLGANADEVQPGTYDDEEPPKNVDPLGFINRPIYRFNDIADRFVLRPAGQGYNFVVPQVARTGIGNFFDNITYPVTIVNSLLQGKGAQAWDDTLRFIINSTFGIFGFMDLATGQGLPFNNEDFGQTFATWGIPPGPYIVLPLLGPSTVRDGIGIIGNVQVNPLIQMSNTSVRDKLLILWTVESRAALIGPDKAVQEAFDPYIFLRDAYLQNRQFLIQDKDKGGGDSDAELDEYFEDFEEYEDDY